MPHRAARGVPCVVLRSGILFSRHLADAIKRLGQFRRFRQSNSEIRLETRAQLCRARQMAFFRCIVAMNRKRVVAKRIPGLRGRSRAYQHLAEERAGMMAEIPVRDLVIGRELWFESESVERLPFGIQASLQHKAVVQGQ